MIRTWIADVTPLYEENCYKKYYEGLPSFRKEKADALKYLSKKAQSVGAWALWERMRCQYSLGEQTVFNLSHSGTWVMCAAQTEGGQQSVRVGCDIQKTEQMRLRVARRLFCREEYERIMREKTEAQQKECFFRFWVLKESFMKATRKGMALPLNSFCIELGNPSRLVRKPEEYTEVYYYREYAAGNVPCKMAVCSTDSEIDNRLVICGL